MRLARRLEARPGPAAADQHLGLAPSPTGLAARPRHRPRAPQSGPPVPPAPSTPVGPVALMRIHIIAEPTPNSACNSPTTLSNPEIGSLALQRFLTLLKLHPIELHATFLWPGPPPTGAAAKLAGSPSTLRAGGGGGFALHEALRGCVAGVSDPRVVQIPPFEGGKATTRGGVVAKLRTYRAETPKMGHFGWIRLCMRIGCEHPDTL